MDIKELLKEHGFKLEQTGGNCMAFTKYVDDNMYYMFTAETGHIAPHEYPVLVGFYLNDDLDYSVVIPTEKALIKFLKDISIMYNC